MLESLGERDQYLHCAVGSQYAHGTQQATALYRSNLGTMKEIGELDFPTPWAYALYLCFHALVRAGRRVLERAGGDPDAFAPPKLEREAYWLVMHAGRVDG